jgi:hypothetical protein
MVMRYLFILSFLLFSLNDTAAQECPENILYITTQQQAESFLTSYPDCTVLKGLSVTNSELNNLNFLQNIVKIEGEIFITQNKFLKTLEGLNRLKVVDGYFRIQQNDSLQNFFALDSLKTLKGDFFYISNNPLIENLSGFTSLDSIKGILSVFQMKSLKKIDAFPKLSFIGGDLLIHQNENLQEVKGFLSLKSVQNSLRIYQNTVLTDISFLQNDMSVKDWLELTQNPVLEYCQLKAVCRHLNEEGSNAAINNNSSGCNSKEEIINLCISNLKDSEEKIIMIYPNPASDKICFSGIENRESTSCSITDVSGRKIDLNMEQKVLDISTLKPGFYFLKITGIRHGVLYFIKN